jgi:hypothetical protein
MSTVQGLGLHPDVQGLFLGPQVPMTCKGGGYCSVAHGTHTRYSHGCRCEECRLAHSIYVTMNSRRSRNHSKGQHGYVDAGPYTEVLGAMYREGESITRLMDVTGCCRSTILAVVMGDSARIQKGTAARLRLATVLLP